MIKAVIFDMYETLITYYGAPVYFGTQMAKDAGVPAEVFLPRWRTTEEGRTLGKWRIEDVLAEILRENNCYSEVVLNLMMKKRMAAQKECFDHLHPEILEMFGALKENGIKIGLVTNCFLEEAESIQQSVLYPYFDAACFSCEEGLQKPDEKIFLKCMENIGVTASECLYVGDGGSRELEAAKMFGMNAVQAVWYLKEGSAQTWSRKEDFVQLESPMDVVKFVQPEILQIDDALRLRKYDGIYDFAFDWYQDEETVYLVDGVKRPYSWETLKCMYEYLHKQGELYFIEVLEGGTYRPIGDVAFWKDDMPIVIGDKSYRGKGIAKKVIGALISRGKSLGYDTLRVGEIYDFNIASRKCFESMGFEAYEKTEKGHRFVRR